MKLIYLDNCDIIVRLFIECSYIYQTNENYIQPFGHFKID